MRNQIKEKGSVLVLVTLLTLVLSAFAIVALRSVSRTVQSTATYTTRSLAYETTASANRMTARYTGERYEGVWQQMKNPTLGKATVEGSPLTSVYGGSIDSAQTRRVTELGPYIEYPDAWFRTFLQVPGAVAESGLFADAAGKPSFEARKPSEYRSILRDPYDFPPPEGEQVNGTQCSKKISIYTEATVGAETCASNADCTSPQTCVAGICESVDTGWRGANNVAQSRVGIEGVIANVNCGT